MSLLVTLSNTVVQSEPTRHRKASSSFPAARDSAHQALALQILPLGAILLDGRRPIVPSPWASMSAHRNHEESEYQQDRVLTREAGVEVQVRMCLRCRMVVCIRIITQ